MEAKIRKDKTMCGRFVMLTADEVADAVAAVEQRRRLRTLDGGIARSQAFPGSAITTIGVDGSTGALEMSERIWGFAPEWSTRPIFNTRIEKAYGGSGMWGAMIRNGRCIIPAAAFFEPHMSETVPSPRTGKPLKRPYLFTAPDAEPLLLAGLRNGDRCSVITTEPNRWVAPIHNRMPLLLRFEEVAAWLEAGEAPTDRTSFELAVQPEAIDPPPALTSEQLSLF